MQIHVVQKGENLWKISRNYAVSERQLIQYNGLEQPDHLTIGQALVIPVSRLAYTVQNGDSLQTIARRYGTTVEAIVRENGLKNANLIYTGQTLRIPGRSKPMIEVNAFTNQYGSAGGKDVRDVGQYLTYASPFGYRMRPDGNLTPIDDAAIIQAAISKKVVPMMAITNFSASEAGTALAHTILSSTALRDTLISNTIQIMKTKGYRGLNVDFENVSPADRELYNQFLQHAVERLHREGYFISSSLAPKISGEQKGLLYEAHDYYAHGHILDFVVLMTYEWGYRKGPPQAISPLDQIRRVIEYAVTVIPKKKILMGFQLYARDWLLPHVQGQEAETFDMQEAVSRAVNNNATILYDTRTQSPYFQYTDTKGRRHEVRFEDARSAQAKFDTVKEFNLRGISYWVLGYPFPQNWALLEGNFQIRKF